MVLKMAKYKENEMKQEILEDLLLGLADGSEDLSNPNTAKRIANLVRKVLNVHPQGHTFTVLTESMSKEIYIQEAENRQNDFRIGEFVILPVSNAVYWAEAKGHSFLGRFSITGKRMGVMWGIIQITQGAV
jgi:hypothetical protein